MKRFSVILLTLAVVISLAAPPLVGRLLASQLPTLLDQWQAQLPGYTLVLTDHKRGWLRSTSELRVIQNQPAHYGVVSELTEQMPFADQPAWLLAVDWAHGPWPITAWQNSVWPAWLRANIEIATDGGPAGGRSIPGGSIYSLGLTGRSTVTSVLEPGSLSSQFDPSTLRWNRATSEISANASWSRLTATLNSEPLALELADGSRLDVTGLTAALQANSASNPPGGRVSLELGKTGYQDSDQQLQFDQLEIDAAATRREQFWFTDIQAALQQVQTPLGPLDTTLDIGLDGLSGPALQASLASDAITAEDGYALLLALANAGGSLELRALQVAQDERTSFTAEGNWQARRGQPARSLGELLLTSQASVRIHSQREFTRKLLSLLDEQTRLTILSMLNSDEDGYVVVAELGDGIVTVNGYPLPLISVVGGR